MLPAVKYDHTHTHIDAQISSQFKLLVPRDT